MKTNKQKKLIIALLLVFTCLLSACIGTGNRAPRATPTPFPIGIDGDGEKIYATGYPEDAVTPEPFSQSMTEPWQQTQTVMGKELTVNIDLKEFGYPLDVHMTTAVIDDVLFEKEMVERTVEYLMGDTYYKNEETKADYDKSIAYVTEQIENNQIADEYIEQANNRLAELKVCRKYALDESVPYELKLNEKGTFDHLSIKSYAEDGDVMYLYMVNDNREGTQLIFQRDMEEHQFIPMNEDEPTDDKSIEQWDEFYDIADEAAEAIYGVEMRGISSYGKICSHWVEEGNEKKYDGEEAYAFYFSPVIDSKSFLNGILLEGEDDSLSKNGYGHLGPWCSIIVDKDGIREMVLIEYIDVVEQTTINQAPLKIETAVDTFKQEIFNVDSWYVDRADTITLNINKVDYGLVRIYNDEGVADVIPVYAFKGYQTVEVPDGEEPIGFMKNRNFYYMLVNAISGEVIQ